MATAPAGGWRLYGIPNCDTVKKARQALEARGVAYAFHDWKKGVDAALLHTWAAQVGWEKLINRSGTTWRKLTDAQKQVDSTDAAVALMVSQPSLIRRPVLTDGARLLVGYDASAWQTL